MAARTSRSTTCTRCRTTSTPSSADPARASSGSSAARPRRARSSTTASSPWCSGSRCQGCSTAGSSTARRSAPTRRSTASSTSSTRPASGRCSRSTSSTTRWAGPSSTAARTGVLVNTGNKWATGQFWTADHCDDPDHDNTPTARSATQAALVYTLFGPVLTQPLFQGQLPVYPPGPHCNPKGLTALGEHLIRAMMRKGMIVETDHMSMKARREALSILEADEVPGRDLEPLLGRSRQPEAPAAARRDRRPDLERGHAVRRRVARRPAPTATRASSSAPASAPTSTACTRSRCRAPNAAANPVRYPFRSFDGAAHRPAALGHARLRHQHRRRRSLRPLSRTGSRTSAWSPARRSSRHGQRRRGVPADVGARRGPSASLASRPGRLVRG